MANVLDFNCSVILSILRQEWSLTELERKFTYRSRQPIISRMLERATGLSHVKTKLWPKVGSIRCILTRRSRLDLTHICTIVSRLKGKGELQTYWLHTKKNSKQMSDTSESGGDSFDVGDWLDLPTDLFNSNADLGCSTNAIRQCLSEQNQRLADWNSNQLFQLLDNVVAHRKAALKSAGLSSSGSTENGPDGPAFGAAHQGVNDDSNIVKDVKDCIAMPPYDAEVVVKAQETHANLSAVVQQQLHDYVSIICSMYVDNPFHSYQHVSSRDFLTVWVFSCVCNIIARYCT